MISRFTEKKWLQMAVAVACLVPLYAGLGGDLRGISFMGNGDLTMDSHFRYLSGLLFGIGLGFLSAIPGIEHKTGRFRLLTLIVATGGCGRLLGFFMAGTPAPAMQFALAMELVVTPLLCLWQGRIHKEFLKDT